MGGCCARQQDMNFDKINSFQYSVDDIIRVNHSSKPELTFEENIISNKEEDIQLSKIIINMKNIFKEKVSTISLIELFNLAIYNKESFKNNEYIIFDMRRSSEQKEEFLKRIKHINYTYEQVKKIEKINKLEILHNFINHKTIILIIPEYYLNSKNNKEGFRKVETYPVELCHLLFDINDTIYFRILNCCINVREEQPSKFEEYLSSFHSYDIIPFILFSYIHVTTFFREGYFFISFLNQQLFHFNTYVDYLNNSESVEINELFYKNKFLSDMNVTCIITIDNNSRKLFDIKEYQYLNNSFKEIIINKNDVKIKKDQILQICDWIKQEILKGHSCYFNIENYNNERESNNLNMNNSWIFVIVILITIIAEVEYYTVIKYLKEKMIFFENINELESDNINKEEIINTLNYLKN